jgi:hypothetical protein
VSLKKVWIVDCDYDEHRQVMAEGGVADGEPAAIYPGTWKRKQIVADLRSDGWALKKNGKRICPSCIAHMEEQRPCPDCGHKLQAHVDDGTGGTSSRPEVRYYCSDYNDGQYCDCKRNPSLGP